MSPHAGNPTWGGTMNEGEAPPAQIFTRLVDGTRGGAIPPPELAQNEGFIGSFCWIIDLSLWNQGGAPSPPGAQATLMCMYQVMYVCQ